MMTPVGPSVLEFNVRMGDPETQPLMMRLESDWGEVLMAAARGSLRDDTLRWSPEPATCVVMAALLDTRAPPQTGQKILRTGFGFRCSGISCRHEEGWRRGRDVRWTCARRDGARRRFEEPALIAPTRLFRAFISMGCNTGRTLAPRGFKDTMVLVRARSSDG